MMKEFKVKFDEEQMGELVARVIEHFAIDNGNITEIVRCKDCKQFRKKGEDYGCCLEGYGNVDGNHYCSFGERKEE